MTVFNTPADVLLTETPVGVSLTQQQSVKTGRCLIQNVDIMTQCRTSEEFKNIRHLSIQTYYLLSFITYTPSVFFKGTVSYIVLRSGATVQGKT